ncbi:hypothetical protein LINGRAHAP2_LOCUS20897 [Linum grandiflorum]
MGHSPSYQTDIPPPRRHPLRLQPHQL